MAVLPSQRGGLDVGDLEGSRLQVEYQGVGALPSNRDYLWIIKNLVIKGLAGCEDLRGWIEGTSGVTASGRKYDAYTVRTNLT